MGYTVISSTPSPYARKVRINLIEQDIPFTLQTEVPWDKDTETPKYNPLEKLPVLIVHEDGDSSKVKRAVYESKVILEYLNTAPPGVSRSLLPKDPEERVEARQIEALADGVADALVLGFFEDRREESKKSPEWSARQKRKVDGGLKAMGEIARKKAGAGGGDRFFLVGNDISIADLAVGSLLGFLSLRLPDHPWKGQYPALEKYWLALEERDSFKQTVPKMFSIKDKVV